MFSTMRRIIIAVIFLTAGLGGSIAYYAGTTNNDTPLSATSAAAQDAMVERSLEYFDRQRVVLESEPQVLMSEEVTFDRLRETGVAVLNLEEGCEIPFYIVIFEGEFRVENLQPGGSVHPDVYKDLEPVRYVAHVYNRETENLMGIISDETGGRFKEILGDPTLPDPEAHPDPEFGPFDDDNLPANMRGAIPCD